MSRECEKLQDNIVAYHDGELDPQVSRRAALHLEACRSCRRELEDLRTVLDCLPAGESLEPSEDFDRIFWEKISRLKKELRQQDRNQGFFSFLRGIFSQRPGLVTSTALAVCILFIVSFAFNVRRDKVPRHEIQFATDMELFVNMEIIEKSEALEHFEVISMLDLLEKDL